ncbi:MAG: AraC family transcriptional regulator [Bacillales bacterium]|nr:AraC family transcriptional regulator [Mollicutes bacterium]MCI7212749.1 AraC family transcriptional regulator [Bacillales bacterium]MDD7715656.1 AraC family transcriptional regulator [Mollicutes bacterium]MDY3903932.1 AraC family transcriptional regulator [Candidatus Enteromonas sp.]MDY4935642.1 AraC family transcriptional regulator [Candidatus Enteromonas sp.]
MKQEIRLFSSKEYSSEDPNLHVFFYLKKGNEPLHTHDFIEIMYINSGEIEEYVNDKHFTAKKGDLVFMNFNSTHSFKAVNQATFYNVCFYPETLEKIINPQNAFSLLSLSTFNEFSKGKAEGVVSFSPSEQRKIQYILERMVEEQTRRLPRFEVVNESFMTILITMILRKVSLPEETEIDAWNELAQYISENLDGNLSLEALAKKCFYNPSYFSRLFKSKFNVSLVEYVSNKRIEKAMQLLNETELSVSAISSSCGFSNKSVFYRTFAKVTGKTPNEYRNKNAQKPLNLAK